MSSNQTNKSYSYPYNRGMKTQLGHAKGLGSAKDGAHHWWAHKISSLALLPLMLWAFTVIFSLAGAPRAFMLIWLAKPVNTGLMILFIFVLFLHSVQSLQVIFEDYIARKGKRLVVTLIMKTAFFLTGFAGIFGVLLHVL